jgi:hypothetical protein
VDFGNELLTSGEVVEFGNLTPYKFERLDQSQKQAYERTKRWLAEHAEVLNSFDDFLTNTFAPVGRGIGWSRKSAPLGLGW